MDTPINLLQVGEIISYHVPEDEMVGAYRGTAPIIGVNTYCYGKNHYVVMHDGDELVVYLDEVEVTLFTSA